MKITIDLTKAEMSHIEDHGGYDDCCEIVANIMCKVEKQSRKARQKK